jgi:hypothetical protein
VVSVLFGLPLPLQGSDDSVLAEQALGLSVSPQHVSRDGSPPRRVSGNPGRTTFERAFPTTEPAEGQVIKVRHSLAGFWAKNIPDSLRTFNIPMDSIFSPICMQPTVEQVESMAARSKCMELLPQGHPSLLSQPNRALPMCFLAKAGEGLPVHMQKALFFFASVANSITDLAHFVVPTEASDVVQDKIEHKLIRTLVSTGEGLAPDPVLDGETDSQTEFISVNEVLEARAHDRPEAIRQPVPPISMHVGFTGAVFRDKDGRERREVFSVLMVSAADCFALSHYILDKFLLKPKMGCQKYEQLMELYLESSSFFREILRYECFCNLGADERAMGLPEDYFLEPGGRLGLATILSPFQIPLKIFNIIKNEHPGADLSSIRIVGCPELTFQRSCDITREWLDYMRQSINTEAKRQESLSSGIERYDSSKDKPEFAAVNLEMAGGWPLETREDATVHAFGLPPLPLMHKFDANGARGAFSVFIASIGDADQALPDLTRAILTAFLVHSSEVGVRPEIDHLLKDKRKANPLLVLRTYYGPEADPFSALVLANRQRMWSEALRSDIQVRRSRGASVQDVLRVRRDYLASVTKNLESMIECQVFRSSTVTQMKAIIDLTPFEEVCTGSPHSIAATFQDKCKRVFAVRKYDTMYRSWHCFMKVWEDMNRFFSLNAGNLLCAVEVMLSQLMFKFAHTNDTWCAPSHDCRTGEQSV